ncbi:MAG: DUF3127 domain-containing protein [Saprospiraceae bacterium]|jgi:hypothetical protein|nr:DUF3127 domain-containing protein [Saprospiraceae bacterium]
MEIKGRIIQLLPMQSGEGKNGTWRKQDYVLETMDTYPKKLCFNAWGDKIDQFAIKQDEVVTVHFDIESREYNGRWYTDVKAWRVDKNIGSSEGSTQQMSDDMPPPPVDFGEMDDDLPF